MAGPAVRIFHGDQRTRDTIEIGFFGNVQPDKGVSEFSPSQVRRLAQLELPLLLDIYGAR